jgi:hypothetical protein
MCVYIFSKHFFFCINGNDTSFCLLLMSLLFVESEPFGFSFENPFRFSVVTAYKFNFAYLGHL